MKFYSPNKTAYTEVTKRRLDYGCLFVKVVDGNGVESTTIGLELSEAYALKEYLEDLIEKVDQPMYKFKDA